MAPEPPWCSTQLTFTLSCLASICFMALTTSPPHSTAVISVAAAAGRLEPRMPLRAAVAAAAPFNACLRVSLIIVASHCPSLLPIRSLPIGRGHPHRRQADQQRQRVSDGILWSSIADDPYTIAKRRFAGGRCVPDCPREGLRAPAPRAQR